MKPSPVTQFKDTKIKHLLGVILVLHCLCIVTGMLMTNERLVYYDLQAESSGWRFKSPLGGGGGIVCRPHYRPLSL